MRWSACKKPRIIRDFPITGNRNPIKAPIAAPASRAPVKHPDRREFPN
jgi:hypothetical protein